MPSWRFHIIALFETQQTGLVHMHPFLTNNQQPPVQKIYLAICAPNLLVYRPIYNNGERDYTSSTSYTIELKVMNEPQKRADTNNSHRMKTNDKNYHNYL